MSPTTSSIKSFTAWSFSLFREYFTQAPSLRALTSPESHRMFIWYDRVGCVIWKLSRISQAHSSQRKAYDASAGVFRLTTLWRPVTIRHNSASCLRTPYRYCSMILTFIYMHDNPHMLLCQYARHSEDLRIRKIGQNSESLPSPCCRKAVQSRWGRVGWREDNVLPGEACRTRLVTWQPASKGTAGPTGVSRGHSTEHDIVIRKGPNTEWGRQWKRPRAVRRTSWLWAFRMSGRATSAGRPRRTGDLRTPEGEQVPLASPTGATKGFWDWWIFTRRRPRVSSSI